MFAASIKSASSLLARKLSNKQSIASLQHCLLSSAAQPKFKVPPNLNIDPKSSFLHKADLADDYNNNNYDNNNATTAASTDSNVEEYDSDDDDSLGISTAYIQSPPVYYAVPLPQRLNVNVYNLTDSAPEIAGTIILDESVFAIDNIRIDILTQAVRYHRNKLRGRRKAVTKTISQVSGSGRKIRNQKGSGRARMGHSRPPHHRGGAKAHGPKNVTDYGNIKLNKKVRQMAMRHALAQKLKEGNLLLINEWSLPSHKTKNLQSLLVPLQIAVKGGYSAFIIDHYGMDENDNDIAEELDDEDDNDDDDTNDDEIDTVEASDDKVSLEPVKNSDDTSTTAASHRGVPANLWVAASNIQKIKVDNHHGFNVYDALKHDKLILTLSALEQLERRLGVSSATAASE